MDVWRVSSAENHMQRLSFASELFVRPWKNCWLCSLLRRKIFKFNFKQRRVPFLSCIEKTNEFYRLPRPPQGTEVVHSNSFSTQLQKVTQSWLKLLVYVVWSTDPSSCLKSKDNGDKSCILHLPSVFLFTFPIAMRVDSQRTHPHFVHRDIPKSQETRALWTWCSIHV